MNTKELIEKQVEEAAAALDSANRAVKTTNYHGGGLFLVEVCERLLQIVQNQQAQIEALQSKDVEFDAAIDGLNAFVARHSFDDDEMCPCGHSINLHGLPRGCAAKGCDCVSFRMEAKR